MKEGGASTPSTYVTPKRRRKPGATDWTDRRARQRRGARKKVYEECHLQNAPVKRQGDGLPLAIKFCSIRKLILDSIVEREEELTEDAVVERLQHELVCSEGKLEEMTKGLGLECDRTLESPQPSFGKKDSRSREINSQSGDDCNSEEVSPLTKPCKSVMEMCFLNLVNYYYY